MKETSAFICIPDITGFTEFMSEVSLESSKRIIPSLLNRIIYANSINLKISEIEGDAVLFYRNGPLPSAQELIAQCRRFFHEFRAELDQIVERNDNHHEYRDLTRKLGLKVIMHYGPIGMVQVGSHLKLMGEEIIVAHRLLKNSVSEKEYVLFSQDVVEQLKGSESSLITDWAVRQDDHYDHIGTMMYHYINVDQLFQIENSYVAG